MLLVVLQIGLIKPLELYSFFKLLILKEINSCIPKIIAVGIKLFLLLMQGASSYYYILREGLILQNDSKELVLIF